MNDASYGINNMAQQEKWGADDTFYTRV